MTWQASDKFVVSFQFASLGTTLDSFYEDSNSVSAPSISQASPSGFMEGVETEDDVLYVQNLPTLGVLNSEVHPGLPVAPMHHDAQ